MMQFCNSGHEQVCYEGTKCPACEVWRQKEAEIKKLATDNDDQLDVIHGLRQENESLKQKTA